MSALSRVHPKTWVRIKRDEALIEQGGRCKYHKGRLTRLDATADHVKAKSKGGTDNEKIVAACRLCNRLKGAMPVKKFEKLIRSTTPTTCPELMLVRIMRRINMRADQACRRILRFAGVEQ